MARAEIKSPSQQPAIIYRRVRGKLKAFSGEGAFGYFLSGQDRMPRCRRCGVISPRAQDKGTCALCSRGVRYA